MLLPTMTPEEIFAEIQKDIFFLQKKISECTINYGKIVKRTTRFPHYKMDILTSRETKIQYYVMFYAYRRGEWDKPHRIIYTEYTHEEGKTLILLENDRFAIRIYTSHFMSRYRERDKTAQQRFADLHGVTFFAAFLLRNKEVREAGQTKEIFEKISPEDLELFEHSSKFYQDEDYERIPMNCQDGLCLTERNKRNPNISIYNTFVSSDLLRGEQLMDFLLDIPHFILRKMEYVYPNQKNVWSKEWDDLVERIDETKSYEEYNMMIAKKLDEFTERYPLPLF